MTTPPQNPYRNADHALTKMVTLDEAYADGFAAADAWWRDRLTSDEAVVVPIQSLRNLYACAKDYDWRIPADGHDEWAEPIRAALAAADREENTDA